MLENRLKIGLYGLLICGSRVPLVLLLTRLRLLIFHKLLEFA